jgi:transcription antitermination factor NusG
MKKQWYLIQCNYGKIDLAQRNLEDMGVECFCPRLSLDELKILFDNKKKFTKGCCIFPPYLFVRFNVNTIQISKIQHTIGIKGFVRFGGNINPIPDIVIDKIMSGNYLSAIDKDVIKLIRCGNETLRGDFLLSMIERALGRGVINNSFG